MHIEKGEFFNLVQELRGDEERFFTYFRMTTDVFDELLSLVGEQLYRPSTNFRPSISPEERLTVTLR